MEDGILKKMEFEPQGDENQISPKYYFALHEKKVVLNELIGKKINLTYTGKIICSGCGKTTKKSFGQGYCYNCFISVPQTEECVLKPELCRAHEGFARDMAYAKENCLVNQYVYLALSGGLKVGVTRFHQIPTRWVDQGAVYAIKVAETPNRYNAGLVEIELKKTFADKTNWRKMLMGNDSYIDLVGKKRSALTEIEGKGFLYNTPDDQVYKINYPVIKFPTKVNSLSFERQIEIGGILIGIKGQYIIFENGDVFNVRTHTGYCFNFNF